MSLQSFCFKFAVNAQLQSGRADFGQPPPPRGSERLLGRCFVGCALSLRLGNVSLKAFLSIEIFEPRSEERNRHHHCSPPSRAQTLRGQLSLRPTPGRETKALWGPFPARAARVRVMWWENGQGTGRPRELQGAKRLVLTQEREEPSWAPAPLQKAPKQHKAPLPRLLPLA